MSVTHTWGYTNGTTPVTAEVQMPVLDMGAEYGEIMRVSNTSNKTKARFKNLTCPTQQPEILTVEAKRVPNVNLSWKPAFPSLSKSGYLVDVTLENLFQTTDEQGVNYQDGRFIRLTFGASDGTDATGGMPTGKDWYDALMRLMAMLLKGQLNVAGTKLTIDTSSQPFLDWCMKQVVELTDQVDQAVS